MKTKVIILVTMALFLFYFTIGHAQATVIRSAIGVTQNTFGEYDSTTRVINVSNQSGLSPGFVSGVTDWGTYFSGTPSHSLQYTTEWWGASNAGLTGSVTFDLGGVFRIDKLALWNEDAAGISSFSVYTSTDDVGFTLVASNLQPTDWPYSTDYYADIFSLTNSIGEYVKLDILAVGYPGLNTVSMGEIAFSTSAIPEPTTMLLLGSGLIGLAGYGRKKFFKK